jgi:hypothetical protein
MRPPAQASATIGSVQPLAVAGISLLILHAGFAVALGALVAGQAFGVKTPLISKS